MNKTDKIYIAGHQGLVGSAIIRKLQQEGYCNLITRNLQDLDLRRQDQVEIFFEQEKPAYVFLAAAKVGGIYANNTYKAEFIYDNLMIATNVIHAAYKVGVKKLLNLGSSCIYPKNAPQPMKEEFLLTSSLEATNEPYAIAKIAAIKLCRYYNEQYGTNFISVMPTNLYGPHDNFNLETSHVLPAILRKLHLAKLLQQNNIAAIRVDLDAYVVGFGVKQDWHSCSEQVIVHTLSQLGITAQQVVLWGSGKVLREFMFVEDLADALLFLMKNVNYNNIGELINIGLGKDLTIQDLAFLLAQVIDFKGKIFFDTRYPDGVTKKLLDVEKLHRLGWLHAVEIEEGIKRVYRYYLREQDVVPSN